MQHVLGGKVEKADVREYGKSHLIVSKQESKLMKDVAVESICWMSHFDYISKIAPGFEITSYTKDCPVASCEDESKNCMQFNFIPKFYILNMEQKCYLTLF